MELTLTQIQKFQALYKKHLTIDITDEDAYEQGLKLVRLTKAIYKPKMNMNLNDDVNQDEQTGPTKDL